MTDYFDRLELELRAATLRGAPPRPRPLPRIAGGIATALGVAAAAAVALVAIVALGHSYKLATTRTAAAPSPYYHVCMATKNVACLTDMYGVLGRPSSGPRPRVPGRIVPSMWFAGQAVHQTHVRLLAQFNRAVQIGSTKTILFVAHSTLGPPNYNLGAFFSAGAGKPKYVQVNWPFMPAGYVHHEIAPQDVRWALEWSYARRIGGYEVTVVPNQVKRVRWSFPAHGSTPAQSFSAAVEDNVAVAYVGTRAGSSVMTEYGSSGHVVAIQYQLMGVKPAKLALHSLTHIRAHR